MIKSFKSKRLSQLFEEGSSRGLPAEQIDRIGRRLDVIHAAETIEDCNVAGFWLHALSSELMGHYAISVTGNWRIGFKFFDSDAYNIDHIDHH